MNTIDLNTLSASEAYRISGTLPHDKIEQLLDAQEQLDAIGNVSGSLIDADQYPAEDFLQDAIDDIGLMAKRLRGDNRADLIAISVKLEDLQLSIARAAEYGRECLNTAIKAVP